MCEYEDKEITLIELHSMIQRLQFVVEEIREKVDEKTFSKKIERTNTMIKTLEDLDEKVADNMERLNTMLLKLKCVVSVALSNLAQ